MEGLFSKTPYAHCSVQLTLQRYLIEYFAQPPSSMRDIGTVMAPLHVSH
jgi:hypothetical protein